MVSNSEGQPVDWQISFIQEKFSAGFNKTGYISDLNLEQSLVSEDIEVVRIQMQSLGIAFDGFRIIL